MIPLRLLPHRISYRPYLGDGSEGRSLGEPVTDVPCRVMSESKVVRDAQGADVLTTAHIILHPSNAPGLGDEVTLPQGISRPVVERVESSGRTARVEVVSVRV